MPNRTWAAGLGIFLGMAPNLGVGEVIKNPVLFDEAAKTLPGVNGLTTPRVPLPIPGGSCRINLPLKNGVPCK